MSDNYDSGFDLVLSDDERRKLNTYFIETCLPEYLNDEEEDTWYGYRIGDRMFDINIWTDDMTNEVSCVVYECDWIDDIWQTNCRHSWTLTEESEDQTND